MSSVIKQITKLSHKCFRALLKKFRRKKKRQQLARAQEEQEQKLQKERESVPGYLVREAEKERNAKLWEEFQEHERKRKHRLWVLREEAAQEEFSKKKRLLERERIKRDEERKRIMVEIEEKKFLENERQEKDKMQKQRKEEALQGVLSSLPDGSAPWHNPLAPKNYFVPSQEVEQCLFFLKTGCCRFGDRCSRGHLRPTASSTLLIKGMYSHFSISQAGRDDYDTDMALEYEESETYQDFRDFYEDVLPEFKKFGRVTQFKVCCNHEPHLRGNVYVQYHREREAFEACKAFNGRYYAGRQLTCEFSNVTNWKSAICGLFQYKRCPKGDNCNFLHVFRNPDNEFWAVDRDYRFDKGNRRGRQYASYSSRSHRSYVNSSHRHYYSERRERHHHYSSKHQSSPQRKKYYHSSESDDSDERSLRSQNRKYSYKHKRSRSPHQDLHRKRSRKHYNPTSSTPSSYSSEEEQKDQGTNHKRKKRKSKKSHKRRRASSEDS